jgi:hypothetical protein
VSSVLRALAARIAPLGLAVRGGFHPAPADDVPALGDGRVVRSLVLIGNVGRRDGDPMWTAFAAARDRFPGRDPLNDWTRGVIDPIAAALGAGALYPFGGPPNLPFQRWAMRAEPVFPSPIGLLIHPAFGLWHAYRAALAFAEAIDLPPRPALESPCASCAAKPCLKACPVDAFGPEGYDARRCAAHLDTALGNDCMELACRARRACPVGADRVQVPDQARFHMRAFRRGIDLGRGRR